MAEDIELSQLNNNTLEIHYWLSGDSHFMDANVENKCNYEVLGIIKELAKVLTIEVIVETEALGEGGLRKWLRITSKEEDQKGTITTAIITALIISVLVAPIGKFSERIIDKLFEDAELQDLQKQKLKLEIQKLRQETSLNGEGLENNISIKKRRSNFYESLEKYPKIDQVSFAVINESKERIIESKSVTKSDFKEYILATDDIEPLEVEGAIIEIIAPVLKKGNYKWIGFYQGDPIAFNMKSNEFKTLVQNGQVEFKNGSSINCYLQIKRKVNNEGSILNVGYDVIRVNKYFENEHPIETKEGRHHRQMKEAQKIQLKLFGKPSEDDNAD